MMCGMGKDGEGSCHGDAGGPVICVENGSEPVLVGIQKKRQTCGGPFLITKLGGYANFIRSMVTAKAITSCGPPERVYQVNFKLNLENIIPS